MHFLNKDVILYFVFLSIQTEYEFMYFSFALMIIINVSWIVPIIDDLFYVSPHKQLNSCVRIANYVAHNSKI